MTKCNTLIRTQRIMLENASSQGWEGAYILRQQSLLTILLQMEAQVALW